MVLVGTPSQGLARGWSDVVVVSFVMLSFVMLSFVCTPRVTPGGCVGAVVALHPLAACLRRAYYHLLPPRLRAHVVTAVRVIVTVGVRMRHPVAPDAAATAHHLRVRRHPPETRSRRAPR